MPYQDLGADFYTELHARHKQANTNRLVRQLERLGYDVDLTETPAQPAA